MKRLIEIVDQASDIDFVPVTDFEALLWLLFTDLCVKKAQSVSSPYMITIESVHRLKDTRAEVRTALLSIDSHGLLNPMWYSCVITPCLGMRRDVQNKM